MSGRSLGLTKVYVRVPWHNSCRLGEDPTRPREKTQPVCQTTGPTEKTRRRGTRPGRQTVEWALSEAPGSCPGGRRRRRSLPDEDGGETRPGLLISDDENYPEGVVGGRSALWRPTERSTPLVGPIRQVTSNCQEKRGPLYSRAVKFGL